MPQIPLRDITFALGSLSLVVSAFSCSAPGGREEDLRDMGPVLPMALFVDVVFGNKLNATYGDEEDWKDVIVEVFEDLHVAVRTSAESVGDDPDLTLRVRIEPDVKKVKGRPEGVFLDVLAWLTIPLLPLWIDDVDVHPGLNVKCDLYRRLDDQDVLVDWEGPELVAIATCMLDRYPFFSWQTMSVLIVPPFVHMSGESERLEARIGPAVRRAVAVDAANFVKTFDDDVLRDLDLEPTPSGWMLSGRAGPDIGRLRFSVDGSKRTRGQRLDPDRGADGRFELEISLKDVGPGEYLSIEAISRLDGSSRSYTWPLPATTAPAIKTVDRS